jgi:hypothetical protein
LLLLLLDLVAVALAVADAQDGGQRHLQGRQLLLPGQRRQALQRPRLHAHEHGLAGPAADGRPILDRGIRYEQTTLEEAAKYALISLDSTMRSNVTVGPPVDLLLYQAGELRLWRHRRFSAKDPDLREIHLQWEHALRKAVLELPAIVFPEDGQGP